MLLGDFGVDKSAFAGAAAAAGWDVDDDDEGAAPEPKANPAAAGGLGAAAAGGEPNVNLGAAAAFAAVLDANAMPEKGLVLGGGADVDVAAGFARFVEAKGLEEADGREADVPGPPELPPPPPNFRLERPRGEKDQSKKMMCKSSR